MGPEAWLFSVQHAPNRASTSRTIGMLTRTPWPTPGLLSWMETLPLCTSDDKMLPQTGVLRTEICSWWLRCPTDFISEVLRNTKTYVLSTLILPICLYLPGPGQPSTCNEHHAVNDKFVKHKGQDVTGIGATACARHGVFCPSGVANFQRGER